MTNSRKVGAFRVRPHTRNGTPTGKWFVDIPARLTGNGRRKRKLFDNQREALHVARELDRRLGVPGREPPQAERSGVLFRDAVLEWERHEELRVATLKKRASTLVTDLFRLRALTAYFGDDDLSAITDEPLAEYQRSRLARGRKPRTINSELGTFSLVMHWAVKQGYLAKVPTTEQIPTGRVRVTIPTPEEVVRLIEAFPSRLRVLVRFLAETGCRKGEALNLTWDCVDELNGYVEIRPRDGWTPKTEQSERSIPVSKPLLDALRRIPKKGPYVFPGKTPDEPMDNFRKAMKTAVEKADIRRNGKLVHLTPQSLRRAHATWQAMRGVNESILQGLLGHALGSRVTRQFYVHPTEEAKRAAVIELPIRERSANADGKKLAITGNKRPEELSGPTTPAALRS